MLRNNGDGTFTPITPFPGASAGVRAFVMADFDNDGDPDAAFIDGTGKLRLYENRRNGVFAPWSLPAGLPPVVALSVADVNHNGTLSPAVVGLDRTLRCLVHGEVDWTVREIGRLPDSSASDSASLSTARLEWADLDNNGALDLICSLPAATFVWLSDESGKLQPLPVALAAGGVSRRRCG